MPLRIPVGGPFATSLTASTRYTVSSHDSRGARVLNRSGRPMLPRSVSLFRRSPLIDYLADLCFSSVQRSWSGHSALLTVPFLPSARKLCTSVSRTPPVLPVVRSSSVAFPALPVSRVSLAPVVRRCVVRGWLFVPRRFVFSAVRHAHFVRPSPVFVVACRGLS